MNCMCYVVSSSLAASFLWYLFSAKSEGLCDQIAECFDQEQPGEPAASRSSQQPASSSYEQAKQSRSSGSQHPQPTQATNSQEVVRSSLQQQQQQLGTGDRNRFRIR